MSIECVIANPAWNEHDPETLVLDCLEATSQEIGPPALARAATVLFTDDEAVQKLNLEWRGKDRPTNVLSFPAEPMPGLPADMQPLGDVALALETCEREAQEKKIPFCHHAAHLVVHGLLHLCGYDHVADADAEAMERAERHILQRLGIDDPYGDTPEHIECGASEEGPAP
ncbi:MAG: rRNA maturation RNase YbeY [Pseudomonadota bacterium]